MDAVCEAVALLYGQKRDSVFFAHLCNRVPILLEGNDALGQHFHLEIIDHDMKGFVRLHLPRAVPEDGIELGGIEAGSYVWGGAAKKIEQKTKHDECPCGVHRMLFQWWKIYYPVN